MPPLAASNDTPSPTTPTSPAAETAPLEGMPVAHSDDVFEGDDGDDGVDLNTLFEPAKPVETKPALASAGGAEPAAPVAPVVATPPAIPAAAPAPAVPVVAPVAAPAAAAPAAPASAPADAPQTMEQVQARYTEHRTARVAELASKTFALNDEQAALLETNPREVIPQLMASVCMSAIEATTVAIANMLPQAIEHITSSRTEQSEAENAFYGKWPALKQHSADPRLQQIAQLFRQMNPTATKEQFIESVGPACMATLGLQFSPAAPIAPQAPAAPSIRPHQPPRSGAPARVMPQPGGDNIFTAMAEDHLNGDDYS